MTRTADGTGEQLLDKSERRRRRQRYTAEQETIDNREKEQIGRLMKALRERHRYSQHEMSDKLGLSNRTSYGHYERGRTMPPTGVLREMCRMFSVEMEYFFPDASKRKDGDGVPVEWAILMPTHEWVTVYPDEVAILKPILDLLIERRPKR